MTSKRTVALIIDSEGWLEGKPKAEMKQMSLKIPDGLTMDKQGFEDLVTSIESSLKRYAKKDKDNG